MKKCTFTNCNSLGHINGKDKCHMTAAACPNYYNVPNIEWSDMLFREECKRNPNMSPIQFCKILIQEPLLTNVTSSNSLYQYRRAQQIIVSDPIFEVLQHFEIFTKIKLSKISNNDLSIDINSICTYRIKNIIFGNNEISTWYQSDYPENIYCFPIIYICEYCLRYFKYDVSYIRHIEICPYNFPPGDEIYRQDSLSIFEVDGLINKEYCRRLCQLAKLFLKQKTVSEVDRVLDFDFYVLTENDSRGCHFIGYFSKLKIEKQKMNRNKSLEKNVILYYNLSCILIMPPYMRKGYGKLLIDFSYELSSKEGIMASPERPLSDLGLLTYRSYWKNIILDYLSEYDRDNISIRSMSTITKIHPSDIVTTLLWLGMIKYIKNEFVIIVKRNIINQHIKSQANRSNARKVYVECLDYNPITINEELNN